MATLAPVIRPAVFPDDGDTVRALFREYAAGLGVDLCFQDFEAELAGLPGRYAPPDGRLLLAWDDAGRPVGCVALRRIADDACEMKRLYVSPAGRGSHLGRRLAEAICAEARAAGYRRICLDTLPSMQVAQHIYRSMGFTPTTSYVFNPVPGVVYLELRLEN